MLRNEHGSSELVTIMAVTLILLIAAQQSRLFLSIASLMRDALHGERAENNLKSHSIKKLLSYSPTTAAKVRCIPIAERIGTVTRDISLCVKEVAALDQMIGAFNFHSIFQTAEQCPLRQGASALVRRTPVSRYECASISKDSDSPLLLQGELIEGGILEVRSVTDDVLIAATGTIFINTLTLNKNSTLISLGDIELEAVTSDESTPRELSLIAPLGEILVKNVSPAVSIRHWSQKTAIPISVPTIAWSNAQALPLLPVVVVGSTEKPLGAAP